MSKSINKGKAMSNYPVNADAKLFASMYKLEVSSRSASKCKCKTCCGKGKLEFITHKKEKEKLVIPCNCKKPVKNNLLLKQLNMMTAKEIIKYVKDKTNKKITSDPKNKKTIINKAMNLLVLIVPDLKTGSKKWSAEFVEV